MESFIVVDHTTSTLSEKWGTLAKTFYSGLPITATRLTDIQVSSAFIYICHPEGDDEFDKILTSVKSKNGPQILIRTSSAGRTGEKHVNDGHLTVLQLRPSHRCDKEDGVTLEDWKTIVEAFKDPSIAAKIVEGEIPNELRRFFETEISLNLIALSILCQGYLIVCANQNHGKTVPDYLKRWVSERWTKASRRVDVKEVHKRGYWDVFGGQEASKRLKDEESEWKKMYGEGETAKVTYLLKADVPCKHPSDEGLVMTDENLVATAFEAIEGMLGANRGK